VAGHLPVSAPPDAAPLLLVAAALGMDDVCARMLPAVHWGLKAKDARAEKNFALWISCANGHLPAVKFLAAHGGSQRRMRVQAACLH